MQKKILASLLVSPVAISAMANINVTGVQIEKWTPSNGAITGGLVNGNKVTVPVGTGAVTNSFVAPAPGTYQVVFGGFDNVVVTVNGDTVQTDAAKGVIQFKVKAVNETVKLVVSPLNPIKGYEFEQGSTSIVFDFAATNAQLTDSLGKVPAVVALEKDDKSDKATELRALIANVDKEKKAIQDLIKKVAANTTGKTQAEKDSLDLVTYSNTDLKLYESPNNAIADKIGALVKEVGALAPVDPKDPAAGMAYPEGSLNAQITYENKVFNAVKTNTALQKTVNTAITNFNKSLTTLEKLYNNVKKTYDAVSPAGDKVFETNGTVPYEKAKRAVAAYKAASDTTFIDANMADPDLTDKWGKITAANNPTDSISAATTSLNNLTTYLGQYTEFQSWYSDESGIEKAYNQARVAISSLKSIDAYTGVFEPYKVAQMKDLSAQYNKATAAKDSLIITATMQADITAAKDSVNTAVAKINEIKETAKALVKEQNDLMAGVWENDSTLTTPGALTVIAALQETLDNSIKGMDDATLAKLGVSKENIATFSAAVKAVQDKINALTDTCETHYKALVLTAEDFADTSAQVEAVKAAQAALSEDDDCVIKKLRLDTVKVAAEAIGGVNSGIEDLEKTLKDYQNETKNEAGEGVNFPNIFKGNVESLKAAYNALTPENYSGAVAGINDQISDVKGFATTIKDVIVGTLNTINSYSHGLDSLLNPYVQNKIQLKGGKTTTFNITTFKKTITDQQAVVKDWNTSYNDIIALARGENVQGQQVYDQAKALSDGIKKTNYKQFLTNSFNTLEESGTAYNVTAVETALNTASSNTKAPVDVTKIQDTLNALKTQISAAASVVEWGSTEMGKDSAIVASTDVKAALYNGFDLKLDTLLTTVNKVIDSQKAYVEIVNNTLSGVLTEIDKANAYNTNSVSGEDAQTFFTKTIGTAATTDEEKAKQVAKDKKGVPSVADAKTLYSKYYTLSALLKYYLDNATVVDNKDAFATTAKGVKDAASNIYTVMQANETALYGLLNVSQTTRSLVEGYLAQLNGNATGTDADGKPLVNYDPTIPEVKAAIEVMNALLNEDLPEADNAVTDKYNVGECAKSETTLTEAYTTITDAANAEMAKLNGEYGTIVTEANDAIIKDSGVAKAIVDANDAYSAAIKVFNAYQNLENEGYKAYVAEQPGSKNHEELYDYASKLIKLKSDVENAKNKANASLQILDSVSFKTTYVNIVNAPDTGYIAKINAKKGQIIADYNTWGNAYFTVLTDSVNIYKTEAENALEAAGLKKSVKTILKSLYAAQADADTLKLNAGKVTDTAKYQEMIGYVMDHIADVLDPYAKTIDLSAAATSAWNAVYDNTDKKNPGALQKIAAWKEAVSKLKNVGADAIEQYNVESDSILNVVKIINADFIGADDKIGSLSGSIDALNAALAYLVNPDSTITDGAYTKIVNLDNAIGQQSALYEKLTGLVSGKNGLEDEFAALKAFVSPMGVAGATTYTEIESGIAGVKNKIQSSYEANKLANDTTTIKGLIATVKLDIEAKYQSVATAEKSFLEKLVAQAKVAYNNASSVTEDALVALKAQNDTINKVAAAIEDLELANGAKPAVKTKFSADAVSYEDKLSTVIAELQATPNYPTVDGEITPASILAELKARAGEIGDDIDEALAGLTPYLPTLDEWKEKYEELNAALDKVTDEFTAAGDKLLAQGDNYKQQLEDIAEALSNMEPDVTAAKAAAQKVIDSNERAVVLKAEQSDLSSFLASVETTLTNYKVLEEKFATGVTYEDKIGEIKENLADMLTWINEQDSLAALTKTSVYDVNGVNVNSIDVAIKSVMLSGSKLYATALNGSSIDATTDLTAFGKIKAVNAALLTENILPEEKKAIETAVGKLEDRATVNGTNISEFDAAAPQETDEETGIVSIPQTQYEEALGVIDGYITEANSIIAAADGLLTQIKDNEYIPGVVTPGETEISSNDIQTLIAWALAGNVTVESLTEEYGPTVAAAADLDGSGDIDITDVTIAIQLLMGSDTESPAMLKVARFGVPNLNESLRMGLVSMGEQNGTRRFAITLDNVMKIVSGQVDLKLPAGMHVVDATVAERNGNHSVQFQDNGDFTRVLIYSMENASFDSTSGAVLYIDVQGDGDLSVDQMVVTDSYMKSHIVAASGSSFVDSIIDGAKEVKNRIYNAAGMMFDKLQNGINIIRDSNGKVRKQMNRNK